MKVKIGGQIVEWNIEVGSYVVKKPERWVPNEFDSWGRGVGIGIVVTPPFPLEPPEVDVRWPGGRCFEEVWELWPVTAEGVPVAETRANEADPDPVLEPGEVMCRWDRVSFCRVPGYEEGYGCPVCKGLRYHLAVQGEPPQGESNSRAIVRSDSPGPPVRG